MKEIILAHLKEIEEEHDVRILFAAESGSRAWGFESADSDWDVRFIYVHKAPWYFQIKDQRDVIECMLPGDVDAAGWDLRKALQLMHRSNPSLFEWLHSPIIYRADPEFMSRISQIEPEFFDPAKSMYHYHSIYNKHNERCLQKPGFAIKRFLYYLRGILACKWLEMHGTLPPVKFSQLLDATVDDAGIKQRVIRLIEMKKQRQECDLMLTDPSLMAYAHRWADYYDQRSKLVRPAASQGSPEQLNRLFYDIASSEK